MLCYGHTLIYYHVLLTQVLGIATFPGEGRVLCWGPGSLHVLDTQGEPLF